MAITQNSVYKRMQRGDTIVEVMIATAIAGLVLTGAFAAANKSSQQIRNTAEHSEAQKIAISGVEALNETIKSNPTWLDPLVTPPLFCRDGTVAATHLGTPVAAMNDLNVDVGNVIVGTTLPCVSANGRYHTFIERVSGLPGTPSPTDTFRVNVLWDGVTGVKQNVSLTYKVRI